METFEIRSSKNRNSSREATIWILGTKRFHYKSRTDWLGPFTLSLYHELHALLFLIDIVTGKSATNWLKLFNSVDRKNLNAGTTDLTLLET